MSIEFWLAANDHVTTNAHALTIVQDAKTHRKLITTKLEHQTTNIKQTRESKHGHKTQTHPKHANENINIYTAQVKPTTVAMAMMINAILNFTMTCADCGNREANRH